MELLFDIEENLDDWTVKEFSAGKFCNDTERKSIENKFIKVTEISDAFNRQSVSFQLSKKDCIHRWLKYKEGYSSYLVNKLLEEMNIPCGGTVLDPFLGSGTTALVCKMNNINSIGFDILPMTKVSIKAKDSVMLYDIDELHSIYTDFQRLNIPESYKEKFNYIPITDGAFPDESEKQLMYYTNWINKSGYSDIAKNLVLLCILNSLEASSYTRKDGQYLAWDSRSKKIINANIERAAKGKKPINRLNKGIVPSIKESLNDELRHTIEDITQLQKNKIFSNAKITFKEGNSLIELPTLPDSILDGAITSPPYCNRYDYTRTYALEMNYLGFTASKIIKTRQDLISCTVENKPKISFLKDYYSSIGRSKDYDHIVQIINSINALAEIKEALAKRSANKEINNKGILTMVDGYFTDLTFIYAEIFRLFKPGASIAVVNDNVRYAGEVIPVDFLSSEIAEKIGYEVVKIYTLRQKKGNSSQQMKKYGKVALRKSITIWRKPLL